MTERFTFTFTVILLNIFITKKKKTKRPYMDNKNVVRLLEVFCNLKSLYVTSINLTSNSALRIANMDFFMD